MFFRNRIFEVVPVALAFGLGVAMVFVLGVNNVDFTDSADYLAAAKSLIDNGTYPAVGGLPFFRPPLYPLFIAGLWSVFQGSILAVKIAQVILNAAACWMVYRCVIMVAGNRLMAFTGAMFFAVNPFFLYNAAAIQTEALQTFLIVLALFLMIGMAIKDRFGAVQAGVLGIVFGFAALCKPSALVISGSLVMVFFGLRFRQKGSLKALATVFAGMLMAILPWSFFNLKTRGEFILINDAGGFNLWAGNMPESIRLYEGSFSTGAEAMAYEHYLGVTVAKAQIDEWESSTGYSKRSFKQREALWQSKAIEYMIADPWLTARLFAWKFFSLWKPFLSSTVYSTKAVIGSGIFLISVYLFGFIGLVKAWKGKATKDVVLLFGVMAVVMSVIHVVIISSLRLRLPYIDPFLTIFAGIGLGGLLTKVFDKFGIADFAGNSVIGAKTPLVSL